MSLPELSRRLTEDVVAALSFLNLVVENNPDRDLTEIEARPDVQEALEIILDWFDAVEDFVEETFPTPLMESDISAVKTTLDRATDDIVERKVWSSPQRTRQLRLRLGWLIDWLLIPLYLIGLFLDPSTTYTRKTWISRLTPNTCSVCRALHGVTIGIRDSFEPYARRAGWTRFYGSLLTPQLHPSCQCSLLYS